MKNIHLLPTDKYSQLVISTSKYGGLFLSKYYSPMKQMGDSYQNIYITSDEEIKEGNWCINTVESIVLTFDKETKKAISFESIKKIILTTDQELIKDGVQAIDDTFLEWFVKNPSCEFVKIVDDVECLPMPNIHIHKHIYKIIIPKEEPKRETLKENRYNNIIERAKFLHVDMVATQIKIRRQLMDRFYREGKDIEGDYQFDLVNDLIYIFSKRVEPD